MPTICRGVPVWLVAASAVLGCNGPRATAPTAVGSETVPVAAGASSLSGSILTDGAPLPSDRTVTVRDVAPAAVAADGRFHLPLVPPASTSLVLRSAGREVSVPFPVVMQGGAFTADIRLEVVTFTAAVARFCSESTSVGAAPGVTLTLCVGATF